MSSPATPAIVLGPQAREVRLPEAVAELAPSGAIATITAGWQEREAEDQELMDALDGRGANLALYERWERVQREDPELAEAHHQMQIRLRELRRLYNRRLDHAMQAWRDVMEWRGHRDLALGEVEDALDAIRSLDDHHLRRIEATRRDFETNLRPDERPVLRREREEVERRIGEAAMVCVAGGHVAVLLNRMRIFDLGRFLRAKPVVAWSGGAMALAEVVVLFHDSPPWGPGHAEAFDHGLGRFNGIVPFPHGDERLRLDDRGRVARLARRFAPRRCVVLGAGSRVDWDGRRWRAPHPERVLQAGGGVRERSRW